MKKYFTHFFVFFGSFFLLLGFYSGLFQNIWAFVWGQNSPNIPVNYWDKNGRFTYSSGNISTLSGAENLSDIAKIRDIKTLTSYDNSQAPFYWEYPHFEQISDLTLLRWVDEQKNIFLKQNLKKTALQISFEIKNGYKSTAIVFDILKRNYENGDFSQNKKVFFVEKNWAIVSAKDFLYSSEKSDISGLQEIILQKFSWNFSSKSQKEISVIRSNLAQYLKNPEFAFSQDEVHWYIPSEVFYQKVNGVEIIKIPYKELQNWIRLTSQKTHIAIFPGKEIFGQSPWSDDSKKYVALTFDDGPHPKFTPKLLQILKEKWVKATFFVLWKNAEAYPHIIKQEAQEGHQVENHSYNHMNFVKLSNNQVRDQVQKTNEIIAKNTGKMPKLFRPPYGSYNASVIKSAESTILLWSVDSRDWKNRNVAKNLKVTLSTVHDGGIILYHDIHGSSVDTIAPLIDELRAKWYDFLTMDEMYAKYYKKSFLPEQICMSMKKC